ncbi:MAG: class I SAM-dependent methyltransferase [Bacteroidetes bacterium]|nr:class I SAM-dependent methyltransferase [Bacteroidota bacterium]
MKEFWNTRYSNKEYAYGKLPNKFFKNELLKLDAGRILMPGEGEGRNAVFAAEMGWEVDAFDYSEEALKKATQLANLRNVEINYTVSNFDDYKFSLNKYDCIALIFVHVPKEKRKLLHQKMTNLLVPGGIIILEGFSKNQISRGSGGPKDIEMLFSKEELLSDFYDLSKMKIQTIETKLDEGESHKGQASVIRLTAIKPTP